MKLTHTNLSALVDTFRTAAEVPNRFTPNRQTHLKRCVALGLAKVEGDKLVITAEGTALIAGRS